MRIARMVGSALAVGALLSLSVVLPALAQQPSSVTVNLGAGRDENQIKGTAVLTAMGTGQTQVVVTVNAAYPDMLAHIHSGTCPGAGPVIFPLTNVQAGKSTTMIASPLSDVVAKGQSINLHKSPQDAGIYVSCGNFAAANAQAAPGALPNTGGLSAVAPLAAALGAALVGAGYLIRRRQTR